jgi:1-acyl-sn-glycerol-3-phosphate acyltransferase
VSETFGWVRASLALLTILIVTPPMMLMQWIAVKTGLFSDRAIPPVWHAFALKMLGIRLHVVGALAERQPLLVASNHVSWTDIMVAAAAAPVNFIAKSEIADWPVGGTFARLQRSVFVDRERRRSSGAQAGEIAERLASGDAIVLFAEGTTSDGNLLLPFKTTLFGAASMMVDAGEAESVAIQPMAIVYTRFHGMPMSRQARTRASWVGDTTLLPHLWSLLREGAVDVEVHFGEPVEYRSGSNRKLVAQEVERRVRALFVAALRAPLPSAAARRGDRALQSRPNMV